MKKFKISRYLCLLFIFLLLTGCTSYYGLNLKTNPGQKLEKLETSWRQIFDKKIETKHFIFYMRKKEKVDTAAQEQFYEYIAKLFKAEPEKKIIYIKCRDSEEVKKITGRWAAAIAYTWKYVIISPEEWENHELIHMFQDLIGESTSFFREGLAVAFQIDLARNILYPYPHYERQLEPPHIHYYLQNKIIRYGKYIDIKKVLTLENFRANEKQIIKIGNRKFYRTNIVYLEAGSFVRYLIDTCGLEKFFQFLKFSDYLDSKELTEEKFLKVYDFPICEIERQWLNFLKQNYQDKGGKIEKN